MYDSQNYLTPVHVAFDICDSFVHDASYIFLYGRSHSAQASNMLTRPVGPLRKVRITDDLSLVHVVQLINHHQKLHRYAHGTFVRLHRLPCRRAAATVCRRRSVGRSNQEEENEARAAALLAEDQFVSSKARGAVTRESRARGMIHARPLIMSGTLKRTPTAGVRCRRARRRPRRRARSEPPPLLRPRRRCKSSTRGIMKSTPTPQQT